MIRTNPTVFVDMPKLHDKAIIRLDADETARLLDFIEHGGDQLTGQKKVYYEKTKERDLAIVTLLLGTGIRVSECVGLDITDVDFNNNGIKMCIRDSPSLNISEENVKTIKDYTKKIAEEMHVCGLMNMQYAIEDGKVFVLEANPRASRTVPLVSKVCNIQMVQLAPQVITEELTGTPSPVPQLKETKFHHYGVKEAVFPFNMFQEVDPLLGPEMRSTGEVLGLASNFGEAFYKAEEATQTPLPLEGTVLISVSDRDKPEVVQVARGFYEDGLKILATGRTCDMSRELSLIHIFLALYWLRQRMRFLLSQVIIR